MTPLALMDKIREWQLPVKSHMAELDPETLALLKQKMQGGSGDDTEKKTVAKKKSAAAKTAAAPKAAAKTAATKAVAKANG